ncbi:hypothetical protein Tco_0213649 [Tanacetum coccineum]
MILKVLVPIPAPQCLTKPTSHLGNNESDFTVKAKIMELTFYILKSINEGTFIFPKIRDTVTEGVLGPECDKLVSELTAVENERYKAAIRAINILLQGLPKYIYTLINHHTTEKDIWDNVQMILEGSEMTRDERES